MDEETARRLYDVVYDRAGLRGKQVWTEGDAGRFARELAKMPGVFREHENWHNVINKKTNKENAETYGMPVEAMMLLVYAGNEPYMQHRGHSESDLRGPVQGIPGNTFGVEIPYSSITPT